MPDPQQPPVLIAAERVRCRISELAREIETDYRESRRLVCIGVLKGALFFMVDLLRELHLPVVVDFVQAASYGSQTVPGSVRISKDIDLSLRGEDVLLIEDIVDSGHTLRAILDLIAARGARSVRICTLLDKPERRRVEVPVAYCGFEIEDVFVVGFGLDYDERWRTLPYIGVCPIPSVSNGPGRQARERGGKT